MRLRRIVDLIFLRQKLNEVDNIFYHNTAEVSEDAIVGKGTRIWNNAQVRERACLGENVVISKDVYIDRDVNLGNNVKVQNGVSVYMGVKVEDDVFLGPHMTFTNDLYPRAFTPDFQVHQTLVKKGAAIGANVTVVCGHTIGKYAMIGAGSVVTKDVPNFALMYGNPIHHAGWVSRTGEKLTFDEDGHAQCPSTSEKYFLAKGRVTLIG